MVRIRGARRLSLRLRADGTARVTIPAAARRRWPNSLSNAMPPGWSASFSGSRRNPGNRRLDDWDGNLLRAMRFASKPGFDGECGTVRFGGDRSVSERADLRPVSKPSSPNGRGNCRRVCWNCRAAGLTVRRITVRIRNRVGLLFAAAAQSPELAAHPNPRVPSVTTSACTN